MLTTHVANVDIRTLAEKYGTPLYAYDRATIERRIADLKGFPTIRYAQKANSNLSVLALMRKHGVLVDAVSVGEIHRALKAGYVPDEIVYTADVFDKAALDKVTKTGIRVNCGSPDMIAQYAAHNSDRPITLRINPGFGHGHSQKTNTGGEQSKHGIWHEQLPDCLDWAKQKGLVVDGIHMHIGSGTDLEHLKEVCGAMAAAAEKVGPSLEVISAGGGLPTPYRPEDKPLDVAAYTEVWLKAWHDIEEKLGKKLRLEIEPGRYLVAESGFLIAEIRAIKKMGKNTFYLLNAGFNYLQRPAMYGAYHPMSVCPANPNRTDDGGRYPVVVGGPLCESGDIFTQVEGGVVESRPLPRAEIGDYLVIHCAGAYGNSMSSNYNSFPLAAEAMLHNGQSFLIRERQTLDDLLRGERIVPLD